MTAASWTLFLLFLFWLQRPRYKSINCAYKAKAKAYGESSTATKWSSVGSLSLSFWSLSGSAVCLCVCVLGFVTVLPNGNQSCPTLSRSGNRSSCSNDLQTVLFLSVFFVVLFLNFNRFRWMKSDVVAKTHAYIHMHVCKYMLERLLVTF